MTSSTAPYILYGAPVSLYSGKGRAYLRKQGIDFVEVSPGTDRYLKEIVPTIGRWIIPVLETPEGELVQDTAVIIDYFERGGSPTRYPAYPTTPVHLAVSHLFELFGGEGLLRPAMHYRWSFDDQNLSFLRDEFVSGLFPPLAERAEAFFEHSSGRMRAAASSFGVAPETAATIEGAFVEWLDLFNTHLAASPYLLGGRPTLGDYALMGPMWAHLFRDPAPTALVKVRAPRVGRWVERMSTSEPCEVEHTTRPDRDDGLFPTDAVPDTLRALMRYVAEEYLAEITAHVEYANEWLAERPDLETGTNGLDDPGARSIGLAEVPWRGHVIHTSVMPYRFWLLQRLQDAVASAGDAATAIRALFAETGLEPLLELRTFRRVERAGYLEVWGAPVA